MDLCTVCRSDQYTCYTDITGEIVDINHHRGFHLVMWGAINRTNQQLEGRTSHTAHEVPHIACYSSLNFLLLNFIILCISCHANHQLAAPSIPSISPLLCVIYTKCLQYRWLIPNTAAALTSILCVSPLCPIPPKIPSETYNCILDLRIRSQGTYICCMLGC